MTGGTYTICLELRRPVTVEIGALGTHQLRPGGYAYTGSAFGPGGLGRVDRHYELAAGERDTRHWHIDYLLGLDGVSITGDVRTPAADVECTVATSLPAAPITGFGASDCDCVSHLAYSEDASRLRDTVASAHCEASSD